MNENNEYRWKKHTINGHSEAEIIFEMLISNLPKNIYSGNAKTTSNKYEYKTAYSLYNHKFIYYNSIEKISILAFDLDYINNKTATEHFEFNIHKFYLYLVEKLGVDLAPNFICQTQKGYQFFYILKNPVFYNQKLGIKYLLNIKRGLTEFLKLDKIASVKLRGVFRNPCLHNCLATNDKEFELNDFKKYAINDIEFRKNKKINYDINNLNIQNFEEGNRNYFLFITTLKFCKNKKNLNEENILEFVDNVNNKIADKIEKEEVKKIAKNCYKYYIEDKIFTDSNFQDGVMNFEKMKNLTREEYEKETKKRQSLAALRTLKIRDKEENLKNLENARNFKIEKQTNEIIKKIEEAKKLLKKKRKKITKVAIVNLTNLNRNTVSKYF